MSMDPDVRIVRWSKDAGALPLEECARKGIESIAGLVISQDIFRTNSYPDAHFCACAEIYHTVIGTDGNYDDHIGVNFRSVEIRNGTYPMLGPEAARMVIQPLSDGKISAHWDTVDGTDSGSSSGDPGLMAHEIDGRSSICRPMALGEIPEQQEGDFANPSFLLLKDPGAGWQLWRRFSPVSEDGQPLMEDGCREEAYTMIYPMLSPHMNWRFRVHDLPGGGVRWEVNSSSR